MIGRIFYGKIKEDVYACQPPGFEDLDFSDRVYKVEKALYGLHQAPKAWYETLSTYLLDNGFHKGKTDKTLFIKRHKGDIFLVQVYVDDIIFGSTKKELCILFEKMMHEKFQMSSMGELTFFLGLQVKQKNDGIFISQDKYDEDGKEVDVHMYRLMIGSLMYFTSSRLDIMFAVCACARYQVNTKLSHLHAVKRIFRKPTRKVTELPQSSDPIEHVADEAVYKELDDRLVVVPGAKKPWRILLLILGLRHYLKHLMIHCSQEAIHKPKSHDKGKAIMIEEPVKLKKKDQIMLDEKAALKLQAELQAKFDKKQRLSREKAQKELEANIAMIETWNDVQAKIDVDHQLAEKMQAKEQQEFTDAE
uniref:Reverse transcriptase Ty1/copia-type domain-containing protein n=1 Tax=Tanacetum cinerariifolium TaxID=118510 RepID=A0A699GUE6_TANCI|nr:hypothetical protein [Tanacetum cinerariifolium]